MATNSTDSFSRTFPSREWYVGLGRGALLLAMLNGCLILLLLLEGGLIISLLTQRGQFSATLTSDQIQDFQSITGLKILGLDPSLKTDEPEAESPSPTEAVEKPDPDTDTNTNTEEEPEAEADSSPPPAEGPPAEAADSKVEVPATSEPAASPQPENAASEPGPVIVHFEESGILPSVWRSRGTWWGGALASIFRQQTWLQQNVSSLMGLILVFAATWLVRVWCLSQLRGVCRNSALAVSTRLRRQLHRQSMRLATEDLDGHGLNEAVELFTREVDRIREGLFHWLLRGSRYPWELAFLVVATFSVDILLATQWCLLCILGWYLISRSQQHVDRTKLQAIDRSERELVSLSESLRAARLIRGYGLDNLEQSRFQERLGRYLGAVEVQHRVQDNPLWLRLMVGVASTMLAAFLFFVLGAKVLADQVSPAGATVFLAAFVSGLISIRELSLWPATRGDVAVAAHKVWRYLDRLPAVSQAVGARFVQPLSKSLHIVDVTYRPPAGGVLLDRVDVQLTAGRNYAVVSLDHSEARAFASLLPRFIEPQSGRVLFDGEDIAWGTLESLRAETMIVSADDPFLPGTLLDNIRAGREEVTLNQATEAAKEARIHNVIARLPQGYETVVEGRDRLFDAGQRLRLSLARALLRNPALLIIEEPQEPLDDDAKQLLDDVYDRICVGRTVIFLPERLSTVRRTDDILMLRHGRIEAMGPHSLLVKESPLYRHWEYMNFNEFRHDGV